MGARPEYEAAAQGGGRLLAERRIGLVDGGAGVDLMGAVADAALATGGEVVGVRRSACGREGGARGDLGPAGGRYHARAQGTSAEFSDACVALPGGLGTLDELFEVWTWAQLGLHRKPVGLLDVQGFYEPLGFRPGCHGALVCPVYRGMLLVGSDPAALLDRHAAYPPATVDKWIDCAEG